MIDNKVLLERMVSISPGARLLFDGKLYQQHIDEDDINEQQLVNECFSCLIDEAYELGIEFYCTREDLCDSFYHLDKVLMLFEVLFPTPLYRSIAEDETFKTYLRSVVIDGAGDPEQDSVTNILSFLVLEHPQTGDIFKDTYDFLIDKMKSTPVFDAYVTNILVVSDTPIEVPVEDGVLTTYLTEVVSRVAKLIKAADLIRNAGLVSTDEMELVYNRIDFYRMNATAPLSQSRYAWLLEMQTHPEPNPMEQALMARYTDEFETTTPIFSAYFLLRDKPMDKEDLISAILGCFIATATKDAFVALVDQSMDRLLKLTTTMPALAPMILIHRIVLILTKGFYP